MAKCNQLTYLPFKGLINLIQILSIKKLVCMLSSDYYHSSDSSGVEGLMKVGVKFLLEDGRSKTE